MLTGTQYQTSYFPNITPHTKKEEGTRINTNSGNFGIYERTSSLAQGRCTPISVKCDTFHFPRSPLIGNITVGGECVASRTEIHKRSSGLWHYAVCLLPPSSTLKVEQYVSPKHWPQRTRLQGVKHKKPQYRSARTTFHIKIMANQQIHICIFR